MAISTKGKNPKLHHRQSGVEKMMDPSPEFIKSDYRASGKLAGKVALVTGGKRLLLPGDVKNARFCQ